MTAAEFKKTAGSIYDTTLGGAAASIDVTGISATYAHLMVSIYARGDVVATSTSLSMRLNGDAAANYDWQQLLGNATAATASESFAASAITLGSFPANSASANLFGGTELFIPHYAGSSNNKQIVAINGFKIGTTSGSIGINISGGSWRSNAAINQITLLPGSGNFVAGTRVTIHALGA